MLNLIWLRTKYNEVKVVYIAHNHSGRADPQRSGLLQDRRQWWHWLCVRARAGVEIMNVEFPGDGWNKYCLHATDGFGEHESQITPWIEKLVRGGFNYFGYLEVDLGWGGFGGWETSGMKARQADRSRRS